MDTDKLLRGAGGERRVPKCSLEKQAIRVNPWLLKRDTEASGNLLVALDDFAEALPEAVLV